MTMSTKRSALLLWL